METHLLLALVPGNETRITLERLQAALEPSLPQACAFPPLVPLLKLSRPLPPGMLLQAKTRAWPRVEIEPRGHAIAAKGRGDWLGFAIPPEIWEPYRADMARCCGEPEMAFDEDALVPIGPHLLLCRGLVPVAPALPRPCLIQAPDLCLFRLGWREGMGFQAWEWEILASHRVAKVR